MNESKTVVATFEFIEIEIPEPEMVTLTVQVIGQGSTSPAVGSHSYEEGTVVPLTATPATGWRFVGWSENVSGSSITMNENKTVVATFELLEEEPPIIIPPVTPDPPVDPQPPVVDPTPVGPQGTVKVSYVAEDGTVLAETFQFTGEIGTNYGTSARAFDGYELIETPANASGSFIDGIVEVVYVYSDGTVVIDEVEDVPLGPADNSSTEEEAAEEEEPIVETTDEEIILDEEIPEGSADQLPNTGHLPSGLFFTIGSLVSALGVYLKRK